jgi:hypothetical protein
MAASDRIARSAPHGPDSEEPPEPPRLRALRLMVTVLTATLILGVVAIAAALVIRVTRADPPPAPMPAPAAFDPARLTAESLALPEGEDIVALGAAGDALMIVTRDASGAEWLRLFDPADGAALRAAPITRSAQ